MEKMEIVADVYEQSHNHTLCVGENHGWMQDNYLPALLSHFEGKRVRVTVEEVPPETPIATVTWKEEE